MTRPPTAPAGSIRSDEILTYPELGSRLHLGQAGLRQLQKAGLRTIEFGRRKYCLGADVLAFFRQLADEGGDA